MKEFILLEDINSRLEVCSVCQTSSVERAYETFVARGYYIGNFVIAQVVLETISDKSDLYDYMTL